MGRKNTKPDIPNPGSGIEVFEQEIRALSNSARDWRGVTPAEYAFLYRVSSGHLPSVAEQLELTRKDLNQWIKQNADFAVEISREFRSDLVRMAISKLSELVEGGNFAAIKYLLSNWGGHEGFGTQVEHSNPVAVRIDIRNQLIKKLGHFEQNDDNVIEIPPEQQENDNNSGEK